MERLTRADLINLAVEVPGAPMHIGVVALLEGQALRDAAGRLRLAEIRAVVEQRLGGRSALRRVLHARRPPDLSYWAPDPDFRVERHVHEIPLGTPIDREGLLRLAAALLAMPLDRAHPLWRIWCVTGLAGDRVAVIVALHHVLADGMAALHLITSLFDPLPGAAGAERTEPPGSEGRPASRSSQAAPRTGGRAAAGSGGRAPSGSGDLAASGSGSRALPGDGGRAALPARRGRVPHPVRSTLRVVARLWRTPRTSLNGPVGVGRRLATVDCDLAEAHRVAAHHGATINDLVLALATGGLHALLRSRSEPVDGIWLHATVAVSLRRPGRPAGAGNRTGNLAVQVPVGEPDPGQRLRLIAHATANAKSSQANRAAAGLMVALARLGVLRFFTRHQHMVNFTETSIVGPASTVSLLGAPVAEIVPVSGLAGNLAIGFLAISYAGGLTIAVQADSGHFPDLPVVIEAMEKEWETLRAAAPLP